MNIVTMDDFPTVRKNEGIIQPHPGFGGFAFSIGQLGNKGFGIPPFAKRLSDIP